MRYRPKDIIRFFKSWRDEKVKKKISIFSICLFISIFIWTIINLSKKYESKLYYPIVYSGIPKERAFVEEADSILTLRVRTSGFRLFYLKYIKVPPPLTINIMHSLEKKDSLENEYFLDTKSIGSEVNEQLNTNTILLGLEPDTISVKLQKIKARKFPVKVNYSMDLPSQYKLYGDISLDPDSITISGKKEFLDTIQYIETKPVSIVDIDQKEYNLSIRNDLLKDALYISDYQVKLGVNVEKYTEEIKEIPVTIVNVPDSISMKVFPENVSLKYFVAIRDYDGTKNAKFRAFVDFNEFSAGKNFLKVKLDEYPENVEIVELSPEKLEFILIKND